MVRSLETLGCWDRSNRDELVGEGLLGLVEAQQRFDEAKGTDQWTYALHRVKGRVLDAIRRKARDRSRMSLDSSERDDSQENRECVLHAGRWAESGVADGFDAFVGGRRRSMESTLTAREASLLLARCLSGLSWRRRQLVMECGLKGKPVAEVGRGLGLTRAKASRLFTRAMADIRRQLLAGGYSLEDFV